MTRYVVARAAEHDSVRLLSQMASEIHPEPVAWLWRGVWAVGKLNLVVGDPGCSKSTLLSTIAAHITRGWTWPDGSSCPGGEVLLIDAEDDPADTIRPRLDAANADVTKVHILKAIEEAEGKTRAFEITDAEAISTFLAERPAVRLVVIDPLTAYLAGIDSHRNSDVRSALAPIAAIAARFKVAVLAISHLNKGQAAAMYRTSGSIGFVGIARAVHLVAKHPEHSDRRVLVPIKNNLGPDSHGFAFDVVVNEQSIPRAVWRSETITLTAEELLAPRRTQSSADVDRAESLLLEALSEGPLSANEIFELGARENLTEKRLRKALKRLGGSTSKGAYSGGWAWRLPVDQNLVTEHISEQ